jgi:sugar phosphate isomerase/epimerase
MEIDRIERAFGEAGITILSGMMAMHGEDYTSLDSIRRTGGLVPDATWPINFAAAQENARISKRLGISLVSFHTGFVPHKADDPRRTRLIERLEQVAAVFADHGVSIALETGQEDAGTMLALLDSLETHEVGVNFDPANMILYGMGNPVAALDVLAPFVRQTHIKDAVASGKEGEWGHEVPVGEGEVDWESFFRRIEVHELRINPVVEREAGDRRVADIRKAVARVRDFDPRTDADR